MTDTIKQPYTYEELKAKIASNDYGAELLLQHAMLLLDKAQPAQQENVWHRVMDDAMTAAHIGVANLTDDYATANKKLNDLICWSIDVDKNLNKPAQQEPVAEIVADAEGYAFIKWFGDESRFHEIHPIGTKLYTADQLAAAVLRERERCAVQVADLCAMRVPASEYADRLRKGEGV